MQKKLQVYIASSFRHKHAVQLLAKELKKMHYVVMDWTEKARPPENLSPQERRLWMDTDHGGTIFSFCAEACQSANLVIYLGTAGQDAGVEIGIAYGAKVATLGICGPLEAKGLMLHGAINKWVDNIDDALNLLQDLQEKSQGNEDLSKFCLTYLNFK